MKRKNGFTLVELLAVIVILGLLLVILGNSILENIRTSKEKIKSQAAKEIVQLAKTYMAETNKDYVSVGELIKKGYVENNATNPFTGENDLTESSSQCIIKKSKIKEEIDLENTENYSFDKYIYININQSCNDMIKK